MTLYNNEKGKDLHLKQVNNENYSSKSGDIIKVCIENKNNEYFVYFIKNNNIINVNTGPQSIFSDGKETLDMNKFNYLFAISGSYCACNNCIGFKYNVSFVQGSDISI